MMNEELVQSAHHQKTFAQQRRAFFSVPLTCMAMAQLTNYPLFHLCVALIELELTNLINCRQTCQSIKKGNGNRASLDKSMALYDYHIVRIMAAVI
jgi:hypothetical protein